MGSARIAIDVGGTFTDVVHLDPETGFIAFYKVPTTPADPTRGVLDGFSRTGAPMDDVVMFNHGTTLGLNALLTRRGARTAVVSTRGFRDVYLLGRTDRDTNYDIKYRKPPALVERADTFEVTERMTFQGEVRTPFDAAGARRVAEAVASDGYASVAVAFLHAYANPAHELLMREVLAEVAPDVAVTLSHELSREYREYERTSTAVLDAYIKPIVRNYIEVLEGSLADDGFQGRFLMTRSGGGAMTASSAREQPVNLILSGPAGGVIGAAALSRLLYEPNLITIDMGGTSLDASLILDNEPVLYQGAEFERLPINTPSLYIHTIGAGGGSIVWLDEAGALQVGPQSAGASPGPASYGSGGVEATFTDAALVLGYLGSEMPLGGELTLDTELAVGALRPTAERLGIGTDELALGVVRISTAKIVGAVRAITVELGRDPKNFVLLAFGGGGGLVAVDVARELGIPRVMIPPGQGAFSALGMLMADVQHDVAQTRVRPLSDVTASEAEMSFVELEADARARLEVDGFDTKNQLLVRTVDLRYAGQEHSVTVTFPAGSDDPLTVVGEDFVLLHEEQYGHTMDDPIEVTTFRVRGTGLIDKPDFPLVAPRASGTPSLVGTRSVLQQNDERVEYSLYAREGLLAGDVIEGPAVLFEQTATTVFHAGDTLEVGGHGEMIITLGVSR